MEQGSQRQRLSGNNLCYKNYTNSRSGCPAGTVAASFVENEATTAFLRMEMQEPRVDDETMSAILGEPAI